MIDWTARDEREAVVAWLRNPRTSMTLLLDYVSYRKDGQPTALSQQNRGVGFMHLLDAADALERGAHLPTPPEEK